MRIIDLEKYNNKRVNGYTSKGILPKWCINNFWYKLDMLGYESLSEYVVSQMLINSNIKNFVNYSLVHVVYDEINIASKCKNFLSPDEELVSIEKLYLSYTGNSLATDMMKYDNVIDRIKFTVDFVIEKTGISDFGEYISTLLELDMFILNEDRHTNNILLIRNRDSKKYKVAPIFGNGLSLLSDLRVYKIFSDLYTYIDRVKAKPFSKNFFEQAEAAEKLYGSFLRIHLTNNIIQGMFCNLDTFYDYKTKNRLKKLLYEQRSKYMFLIDKNDYE